MKKFLYYTAATHRFLRRNLAFITELFLASFLSFAWYLVNGDRTDVMICYGFTLFLSVMLITRLINCIDSDWKRTALKGMLLIVTVPVGILELFVVYNYGAILGAGVVGALLETNLNESVEFLRMYVGPLEIACATALLVIVYLFHRKKLWLRVPWSGRTAAKLTAVFLLIASVYTIRMIAEYNEIFYRPFLPVHRFALALDVAVENMLAYNELRKEAVTEIKLTRNDSRIQNVVFILGESTNRNHMALYGYYLANTPKLIELKEKGEIAVYTDVVSPHSNTIPVLQKLFTFSHNESEQPWYKYNNLIDIMNAAGYKTHWLSNQESSGIWGNVAQYYGERSDVHRYTRLRESREDEGILDEELFPLIDEAVANRGPEKNFFVTHLMGGHGLYYNRYPYSYHKFQEKDIKLNVNEANKLIVAEYDNALYYNDFVVTEIINRFRDMEAIVIYLPDHGEAVYDEGAGFAGHIEENANRHMIEVPLIFWASEKFREKYPEKWAKILSCTERPYMTDDMIHTVLDLVDVATGDYEPERSIINRDFDNQRVRMFDGADYDREIKEDHE
ncbi:MAG: phosphoethanolamine transferase [Selenomonadaceae bacterium]|nr:phosphoethanolamine transferase [Selenomonadaceae bacterium]